MHNLPAINTSLSKEDKAGDDNSHPLYTLFFLILILFAIGGGFEPPFAGPEPAVLPLNDRGVSRAAAKLARRARR